MTKTAILIPARYASTRYPGKPLVELTGPDGPKTLIRRTWDVAQQIEGADSYVCTDDERIADHARGFGAEVIMTSSDARNGTERCAEALAQFVDDKSQPLIDIGCGTGLAGLAFRAAGFPTLDGVDLTPAMIAHAEARGIYRTLRLGQVDDAAPFEAGRYALAAAVVLQNWLQSDSHDA